MFNVGDIIATSGQLTQSGKGATINISSISNYIEVYNMVKKLQTDIYTDVMYPNDKRPKKIMDTIQNIKDKKHGRIVQIFLYFVLFFMLNIFQRLKYREST